MRTPEQVIKDLSFIYHEWKANGTDKDKLRKEFFESISNELSQKGLAQKSVTVEANSLEEAQDLVEKQYPSWSIVSGNEAPGEYQYLLEENPEFLPFSIEHDGYTWARQIRSGSVYIDDERLEKEDIDLWWEATEFPMEEFILCLLYEAQYPAEEVEPLIAVVAERFGLKRQIKSLESLDPETLAKLQKYMYEGKPSVALASPKKNNEK